MSHSLGNHVLDDRNGAPSPSSKRPTRAQPSWCAATSNNAGRAVATCCQKARQSSLPARAENEHSFTDCVAARRSAVASCACAPGAFAPAPPRHCPCVSAVALAGRGNAHSGRSRSRTGPASKKPVPANALIGAYTPRGRQEQHPAEFHPTQEQGPRRGRRGPSSAQPTYRGAGGLLPNAKR